MRDEGLAPEHERTRLEVENSRMRQEILTLRQFIDSMQNLIEAAERPLVDSEIMALLGNMLDDALRTIDAQDGSLLAMDEDTRELVFVLARGDVSQEKLAWRRVPAGEGIAGWVAEHGESTIVNDVHRDGRFYSTVDVELGFATRSVLAAPIVGGGKVLGVIEVLNKRGSGGFEDHDLTLLTLMCRFSGELLHSLISRGRESRS